MSSGDILGIVTELGYQPEIALDGQGAAKSPLQRVDIARLPEEFRTLFGEAQRARKSILLDFTAPG